MRLLSYSFSVHILRRYSELLRHSGEAPVAVRRCETVEEVLREADVSAWFLIDKYAQRVLQHCSLFNSHGASKGADVEGTQSCRMTQHQHT
jgi:hypothetical protein